MKCCLWPRWGCCHHANRGIVFLEAGTVGMPVYNTGYGDDVIAGLTDSSVNPPSWNSGGDPYLTQILWIIYLKKQQQQQNTLPSPTLMHMTPPNPFQSTSPAVVRPDRRGTQNVHFNTTNHHCLQTMGPKESSRQRRKHLLLSRNSKNSRKLRPVSYMPQLIKHTNMCARSQLICRH